MSYPILSPVKEGTRWPSGTCVELALLPWNEEELACRVGLPLMHGIEAGLGKWAAIGGRLPSGADVELICYALQPNTVILRSDKNAAHAAIVDETLKLLKLSRKDARISYLAGGQLNFS